MVLPLRFICFTSSLLLSWHLTVLLPPRQMHLRCGVTNKALLPPPHYIEHLIARRPQPFFPRKLESKCEELEPHHLTTLAVYHTRYTRITYTDIGL